ncbi:hypothetical protein PMI02_02758, partial [Novosphingobium sp. AP12]
MTRKTLLPALASAAGVIMAAAPTLVAVAAPAAPAA